MGTMTSYSSYNDVHKPIIGDAFRISVTNSFISFCAGFAVFSTVGYLIGQNSPVASKTASIGLAFIAYPAAIETMPAPNLWAFILSITLFTLGIDSAFSMLEAASTVMQDSPLFRKWPTKVIALFLVVLGAFCSLFFSFNWGFTLFDVVDNYLNTYLMLVVGILETTGCGWIYEVHQVAPKSKGHMMGIITLTAGYWVAVIACPVASVFSGSDQGWIGLVAFWAWMLIVWAVSFFVSKLSLSEFISEICFCGVRKLSRAMVKLSKKEGDTKVYCWECVFESWWNFSIKYFVPFALMFLLCSSLKNDIENPYNDYHILWQCIGFSFPAMGLIIFILGLIFSTEKEPFNEHLDGPFDPNDRVGTGRENVFAQDDDKDKLNESEKAERELAKITPAVESAADQKMT